MSPRRTPAPSAVSDVPGALFGHSGDGILVALVDDNAYAMMPGRDGKHYFASGWRIARPMAEWTRSDFYGHGGDLADESAFRSKVLEQAQHIEERRRLGRHDIPGCAHTPWGPSQGGTVYAEGITSHSTAGHGGFKLSADRNRYVHPMLCAAGGWYEEDECWAIVAFTFPELFTALERRHAEQTIKTLGLMRGKPSPAPSSRRATPAGRTSGLSRRSTPTTGSSFQRSPQSSNTASSSASRRPVASVVWAQKSVASSFLPPNTTSAGLALSSTRIGTPSMPARPVSSAGRAGGCHDRRSRAQPRPFPPGRGAPADTAATGPRRSADHAPRDRADPWPAPQTKPLSSRQGARSWHVPRELSCPTCRPDRATPAGDRRPIAHARMAGTGDRPIPRLSWRSRRQREQVERCRRWAVAWALPMMSVARMGGRATTS